MMDGMRDTPTPLADIPDEDLDLLAEQAGEILAEQASGFGHPEATVRRARQWIAERNRRAFAGLETTEACRQGRARR
jgi:hypothetical protein